MESLSALMAALLVKNGSIECHVLGRNFVAPKKIQNLLPIQKREHIIRAFISQTFPAVRVDMIHHETDILLRIGSKVSSFRKKTAYKFMVAFRRAFLVGRAWITTESSWVIVRSGYSRRYPLKSS